MKIAIDVSPISKKSTSEHKVRGVGSYINSLVDNLEKYDKENNYVFVEDGIFPNDSDLIHYPYFDPFFKTLPDKFIKKTVVTVHDFTPLVFKKHFPVGIRGNIRWFGQKNKLKKANAIITDSDCSKKDIVKIVGFPGKKVKVVYLSVSEEFRIIVDKNKLSEISKKYSLPNKFFLYVGDATWNKNLPNLIKAFKGSGFNLVMVGKVWETKLDELTDSPWSKDLKYVLEAIQGDLQFKPLGFVPTEDLALIYNLSTALVMPSVYEGFGLPVLEAMRCGCPVITSRGGSLPEVGGDAVIYLRDTSSESIISKLGVIYDDPVLSEKLARKGTQQSALFSADKMVKNLVSVYKEVYESHNR